jgi:hypothetical protein
MRGERRQWLRAAAAMLALQMAWLREALAAGSVEKGVHRLRGDVRVNGAPAREGMDVNAGDVITTGADSEVVFVTGKDAFLVRSNSRVEAQGVLGALVLSGLRVVTGAVLSVFSPGEPKTIRTATATIGIRGTALYLEVEPERTYICTCYGEAELVAADDPSAREVVSTKHHDEPRYVMAKGAPQMLMKGPVINHTDAELVFLESLAGRKPPFLDMPGYQPGRY